MASVNDGQGASAPANMVAVQQELAYNIVVMEIDHFRSGGGTVAANLSRVS